MSFTNDNNLFSESGTPKQKVTVSGRDFLIFMVHDGDSVALKLGVDAYNVEEILNDYSITYLPMVPGYVRGIFNMRGQILPAVDMRLLLDKTEGSRVSHTIFQVPSKEGKGILVTPTVDGNLLTGPTASKVESPDSKDTTAEGLAIVEKFAAKSVPNVNFRQVITSFTGVRSSEKSGDFINFVTQVHSYIKRYLVVTATSGV